MNIIEEKLQSGKVIRYKQLDNGTCYHEETSDEVIKILETARENDTRIRLFYGDTKTGRCWMEEHDIIGTIGRSTGRIKIPLLIENRRSSGGCALLDHCIIRIDLSPKVKRYQHPLFNMPEMVIGNTEVSPYIVICGEVDHARFLSLEKAKRYIAFMRGDRWAK